jgi:D-beta-D-heptose 7-phosphate kinase/D-beta-D-heptose 1-phosphate adenosyltransferase
MNLPGLDPSRAHTLIKRLDRGRVLVVGDLMVDRFVVGSVTRISPEAPVPVVRFGHDYARLGGAANVAHNLAALGARVQLVGVLGADSAAARGRELLEAAGVPLDGVVEDASRPTVEKVRIIAGRNQQVARIDYEDDCDIRGRAEEQVVERIVALARNADILLVSDYLKGVVTKAVMGALVELRQSGRPLIVDPKIPHLDLYRGATLVTPNNQEAETATHRRIRSDDDAQAAAHDLRERIACDAVLITRGEHGMWLSSGEVEGAIGAVAREVADVTGAGDTVVATLALALAAGGSLAEAATLANHAAGVVVGKFGPATVTVHELLAVIEPTDPPDLIQCRK